ncbi:MAG: hypothetical protein KDK99_07565 [Verrucomicrobiales bacterium]|nr:hypothetical protein [Verrucomicrobiales bacterium]
MITAEPLSMVRRMAGDWPDWMNPLLVRCIRQGLRSHFFEGVFLWLCGSSCVLILLELVTDGSGEFIRTWDLFFWGNAVAVMHGLLPARLGFAVQEDRGQRGLDLLKITKVGSRSFAWPHVNALLVQAGFVAVVLLPLLMLRYFSGQRELVEEMIYLSLLWVSSMAIGFVVMWWSMIGGVGKFILGGLFLTLLFPSEAWLASLAFLFYGTGRWGNIVIFSTLFFLLVVPISTIANMVIEYSNVEQDEHE